MLAAAWDRYDVPALLRLDEVGEDLFRNRFNQPNVNAALFSGQVVAQALAAASRTVAGRSVHSLHAYFLRPGSADRRALYRIEHIRDGRNFTTRRVAAIQDGRTLLEMLCSFATRQAGFAHQAAMPNVLPPEALSSLTDIVRGDDTGLPAYICQRRSDSRPARRSKGTPMMARHDDMQRGPIGPLCISLAAFPVSLE